ncbi:MAG: HNH endonuclease, partial [Nostocaceae cyanobacterium]|nr:HNH endonuclease [Nostocaceae cyanobacterium]
DPDLKFEIFERLNTGAIPLNEMELRNCVYRGKYIELLKKLADDDIFTELGGLKKPDKRMKDVELVLRFAAFYHATYLKYQSPMKRFFNQDMEKYKNINEADADALLDAFKKSVQIVKSLFGSSAFKRFYRGTQSDPNGIWESQQFNTSLYDVLMGVFHDKDKNQVYAALDSIREGLINLMTTNQDYIDSITLGTSEVDRVRRRFDLTRMLVDDILTNYRQQPRCFSLQLKRELYDADPTCTICAQKIQDVDDAAVDHIDQYWRGGKTIPENARLTHRYCNMARSRSD